MTLAAQIGRAFRRRGATLAAAAIGLVIGVAAGAPAVAALARAWRDVVTPAFLELYLAGIPLCS